MRFRHGHDTAGNQIAGEMLAGDQAEAQRVSERSGLPGVTGVGDGSAHGCAHALGAASASAGCSISANSRYPAERHLP